MSERNKQKKRRSYSDDDKAAALAVVDASPSVRAAAEVLEIPATTLQDWAKGNCGVSERVRALREQKKDDLASAFEEIAWRCLASATDAKFDSARLTDLSTFAGTAVDKMRLLRGEATSLTGQAVDWLSVAQGLAEKYKKPIEEVKADLVRKKPELASILIQ